MATIQNKSTVQNTQDFITIQDLFYLCLDKWHWFAISLYGGKNEACQYVVGLKMGDYFGFQSVMVE